MTEVSSEMVLAGEEVLERLQESYPNCLLVEAVYKAMGLARYKDAPPMVWPDDLICAYFKKHADSYAQLAKLSPGKYQSLSGQCHTNSAQNENGGGSSC